MEEFHNTPVRGHNRVAKILAWLNTSFSWQGIGRDAMEFVATCLMCQQTKYSAATSIGLL